MVGFDDIKDKATDIADAAKDKATDIAGSDKVEAVSDKVLDAAEGVAKKVTGGKFDDQIDSARDAADDAIGQ